MPQTKGKGNAKASQGKGNSRTYSAGKGPHLSAEDIRLLKEYAKEQKDKADKERKQNERLAVKKRASKMISKFAAANNLQYKEGDYSSSDSDDDTSSSRSDASESARKKKKRNKKLKEKKKRKIEEAAAQADKIKKLEAELEAMKKSQRPHKKRDQEQSVNLTSQSIITTTDQLKAQVQRGVSKQHGKLPKGFKLPYQPGTKIKFDSPQELEEAIDLMVQAAIEKHKHQEKSVVQYNNSELKKALAQDTPVSFQDSSQAQKQESRRARRRPLAIQDKSEDHEESELEKKLCPQSNGRMLFIETVEDVPLVHYTMDNLGVERTLDSLKHDAILKSRHDKITSKHFQQCFKDAIEPQAREMCKKPLSHSKDKVKALVKELKLEKYLEKDLSRSTLPELITTVLCAIRALPTLQ